MQKYKIPLHKIQALPHSNSNGSSVLVERGKVLMDKSDFFIFIIFLFLISITLAFSQGRSELPYPSTDRETPPANPMLISGPKDNENLMIWIDFEADLR
jgi:hypothetical protein